MSLAHLACILANRCSPWKSNPVFPEYVLGKSSLPLEPKQLGYYKAKSLSKATRGQKHTNINVKHGIFYLNTHGASKGREDKTSCGVYLCRFFWLNSAILQLTTHEILIHLFPPSRAMDKKLHEPKWSSSMSQGGERFMSPSGAAP
uniref:Uncharacterized protein n=1 Tax=Medicago truncatula TaxID=3880 RepID=Q1RSJ2_MEDTR|nr:hypothetical protein MtrDRAFT_AC161864g26v2 [Medicago truncatula]